MANTPASGIYHPEGTVAADIASILDYVTASLDARVISTFASTSARDAAFSGLTAAQRAGAKVYVSGVGWMGYNASSGSYNSANWLHEQRVKYGYTTGTIEGNNMLRIPSAQCFFDGVAPTAIVAMNAGVTNYKPEWGLNDGAGVLLRIMRDDGVQLTSGNTAAVFWIAGR